MQVYLTRLICGILFLIGLPSLHAATLAEARLPMPETIAVWEDREHSFTVADVMPDVLSLRQISETGRLIDQYQIRRRIPASCPAE